MVEKRSRDGGMPVSTWIYRGWEIKGQKGMRVGLMCGSHGSIEDGRKRMAKEDGV